MAGPWRFELSDGLHRYELQSQAIVEAMDAVDAVMADTMELSAYITYVVDRDAGINVLHGTVDSFTVQGGSIPPASHGAALPIPFQLITDSSGQVLELTSSDTSSCGSPAGTLLAIARDLLIPIPAELHVGEQWTDTTSAISCRGDIPITLGAIRTFQLSRTSIEHDGIRLHVRQESTINVSGTGTRRIQSTTVTGVGRGWSERTLDPTAGILLGGHGEAILELTFDAASRRMMFRQRVQHRIRKL